MFDVQIESPRAPRSHAPAYVVRNTFLELVDENCAARGRSRASTFLRTSSEPPACRSGPGCVLDSALAVHETCSDEGSASSVVGDPAAATHLVMARLASLDPVGYQGQISLDQAMPTDCNAAGFWPTTTTVREPPQQRAPLSIIAAPYRPKETHAGTTIGGRWPPYNMGSPSSDDNSSSPSSDDVNIVRNDLPNFNAVLKLRDARKFVSEADASHFLAAEDAEDTPSEWAPMSASTSDGSSGLSSEWSHPDGATASTCSLQAASRPKMETGQTLQPPYPIDASPTPSLRCSDTSRVSAPLKCSMSSCHLIWCDHRAFRDSGNALKDQLELAAGIEVKMFKTAENCIRLFRKKERTNRPPCVLLVSYRNAPMLLSYLAGAARLKCKVVLLGDYKDEWDNRRMLENIRLLADRYPFVEKVVTSWDEAVVSFCNAIAAFV